MPLWAGSGTEPPESSSDAVDVTAQGQMLWTVEDAREEVNFPRRFSPLASREPRVVSARASVSPCRGCFGHCELRVPARVCLYSQTRHLEMAPEVCMISLWAHPRSLRGLCSGDRGVSAEGGRKPCFPPISCLCWATECFCLGYSLLPHSHMFGRQSWDAGVAVWFFVLLAYLMYFNWIGQRKNPKHAHKAQGIRTRPPFPQTTNG